MKKAFKIYGWAWVALIVVTILSLLLMLVVPSHHDLAADPYRVEQIVDVDLPDIASVESDNNLDRGASRWDAYWHDAQFGEKLSEETIKQLDELCKTDSSHWSKNTDKGCYFYSDGGGEDYLYSVSCHIYDDHFYLTYYIDEDEGIFIILILFLAYQLLFVWGIVLIVVAVIRGAIRKKKEADL